MNDPGRAAAVPCGRAKTLQVTLPQANLYAHRQPDISRVPNL